MHFVLNRTYRLTRARLQVEVHCSERGRALAHAWNASVDASEAAMAGLRASNGALRARMAELVARNEELAREFKAVEFLRREALRFRKAMEEAQQRATASAAEGERLKARLAVLEADAAAVDAFTRKRCGQKCDGIWRRHL